MNSESKDQEFGSVLFLSSKDEASLLLMAHDLMSADLNMHLVNARILEEVR